MGTADNRGTHDFRNGIIHVPVPSADTHASTKKYVDDAVALPTATDWQPSVLDFITNNTLAPPAEALGNRYILSKVGGAPHVDWDGAAAGDLVEFNGVTWDAWTPTKSMTAYVEDVNLVVVWRGGADWEGFGAVITYSDLNGKPADDNLHSLGGGVAVDDTDEVLIWDTTAGGYAKVSRSVFMGAGSTYTQYDAIVDGVGSNGRYLTLKAAIDAGWSRILVIGSTTEAANITLPADKHLIVHGIGRERVTINMQSFTISNGTVVTAEFAHLGFKYYGNSPARALFDSATQGTYPFSLTLLDVLYTYDPSYTAAANYFVKAILTNDRVNIKDLWLYYDTGDATNRATCGLKLGNATVTDVEISIQGVRVSRAATTTGHLTNILVFDGGVFAYDIQLLVPASSAVAGVISSTKSTIDGLYHIPGTGAAGVDCLAVLSGGSNIFSNFYLDRNTTAGATSILHVYTHDRVSNVYIVGEAGLTVVSSTGATSMVHAVQVVAGDLSVASGASSRWTDCYFKGTTTIDSVSSYCRFVGCTFYGAATVDINAYFANCHFGNTLALSGNQSEITNSTVFGAVSVTGDYISIGTTELSAGITIAAGATDFHIDNSRGTTLATDGANTKISNCHFTGQVDLAGAAGLASNCHFADLVNIGGGTSGCTLLGCDILGGVHALSPSCIVDGCIVHAVGILVGAAADYTRITNNQVLDDDITVEGDTKPDSALYCSIANNAVTGAGHTIIIQHANNLKTIVIGNHTAAAITDNGTSTELGHNIVMP